MSAGQESRRSPSRGSSASETTPFDAARGRKNDSGSWTLSDVERMCKLTSTATFPAAEPEWPKSQLTDGVLQSESAPGTTLKVARRTKSNCGGRQLPSATLNVNWTRPITSGPDFFTRVLEILLEIRRRRKILVFYLRRIPFSNPKHPPCALSVVVLS